MDNFNIRTTSFSAKSTYGLEELLFYIPNKMNEVNVYVMIVDSAGTKDIVPLQFVGNHNEHKKYKINHSTSIRIKSGECQMYILTIDSKTNMINTSTKMMINLSIENYKLMRQLYIVNELNNTMGGIYEKILHMSEMNVELYEKMLALKQEVGV
jgi:hypothetical protein